MAGGLIETIVGNALMDEYFKLKPIGGPRGKSVAETEAESDAAFRESHRAEQPEGRWYAIGVDYGIDDDST